MALALQKSMILLRNIVCRNVCATNYCSSASNSKESDMPEFDMENPFKKDMKRCLLCDTDVELDYKNAQLLSQFISPHTGRIYPRYKTQLCIPMQKRISRLVKKSALFGYITVNRKETLFLDDPKIVRTS